MPPLAQPSQPPRPGAARQWAPHPAQAADLQALGLPLALPPDWRARLREALTEQFRRHRALSLFLDSCVGCGLCLDACPFFQASGDPLGSPRGRLHLLDQARRQLQPALPGMSRPALAEDLLTGWLAYFHQCSLCRRCAQVCPLGIDVSQITLAARQIMAEMGLVPRHVGQALGNLYRTGNHNQIAPPVWSQRMVVLEAWLKAQTGRDILCPVDEQGAQVLLIPPSADLAERPSVMAGYAKMFHAAGVSWTTSTYIAEAENWGELVDYHHQRAISRRVVEAALLLRPQYVVWGEAGRGWALAHNQHVVLDGPWHHLDRLQVHHPVHVISYALDLMEQGAFIGSLTPQALAEVVVTCHDPCHLARSWGRLHEPRHLLAAAGARLVELPPALSGAMTWCCGGGGGLGCPEMRELTLAAQNPLMEALADLAEHEGVRTLATPCATCRAQLAHGCAAHHLPLSVSGVLELFGQALYPTQEG